MRGGLQHPSETRQEMEKARNFRLVIVLLTLALIFSRGNLLFAQDGRFSIGVQGGGAIPKPDEAVDGYPDTRFKSGFAYGLSAIYRFSNGFALGVDVQQFAMDLEENGFEIGKATLTPCLLLIGLCQLPKVRGLSGHIYLGLGYSSNDFDKGSGIEDSEKALEDYYEDNGYDVDVSYEPEIEDSFVLAVALGGDYFFNQNIALYYDVRILSIKADNEWTVKVTGDVYGEESWTDELHLTNMQCLIGLRYWF